jgi:aminoglycoside phosphotransferase (APT) family kinase protein
MPYEVGHAKLVDGRDVVIKISEQYRGYQKTSLSERRNEYANLQAVAALKEARVPKPLYFKGRTLIMTLVSGVPIGKRNTRRIKPSAYVELGKLVRKMNDMDAGALPHAPRIGSFKAFFDESVKTLFAKRLALDIFPREFYVRVTDALRKRLKRVGSFDTGVIWRDGNSENILIAPGGELSGIIDFADLAVGPRILQFITLIPTIGEEYARQFARGYGAMKFKRNYKDICVRVIGVLSSLKAIALAHKEGDGRWLRKSLKELEVRLGELGIEAYQKKKPLV